MLPVDNIASTCTTRARFARQAWALWASGCEHTYSGTRATKRDLPRKFIPSARNTFKVPAETYRCLHALCICRTSLVPARTSALVSMLHQTARWRWQCKNCGNAIRRCDTRGRKARVGRSASFLLMGTHSKRRLLTYICVLVCLGQQWPGLILQFIHYQSLGLIRQP